MDIKNFITKSNISFKSNLRINPLEILKITPYNNPKISNPYSTRNSNLRNIDANNNYNYVKAKETFQTLKRHGSVISTKTRK